MANRKKAKQQLKNALADQTQHTLAQMEKTRQDAFNNIVAVSKTWNTLTPYHQEAALSLVCACTAVYRSYSDQLLPTPKVATPQQLWDRDAGCALINTYNQHADLQTPYPTNRQLILAAYHLLTPASKANCTQEDWIAELNKCLQTHCQRQQASSKSS